MAQEDTMVAEDTQISTDTTQQDGASDGLPVEGQQAEGGQVGGASATQSQEQQPQAAAPVADGNNPAWWKPDLFSLKYRGAAVSPKDYKHATALMQKGWSYEQSMEQVKREKAEIDANRSRYEQYERLEKAFNENPAFKQRILQLQQETANGQVQQQGQQAIDPRFQQVTQKLEEFDKFVGSLKEQQADQAVSSEIESLRSKFGETKFDEVTESGHTLMWDILNHAHTNKFPSLLSAYRDYMFDNVAANAKMQGAQQVAQQRQSNARKGVVSVGTPKPAAAIPPQDMRNMSYDQITEFIKRNHGVTQ
jgi:hypothetical protein